MWLKGPEIKLVVGNRKCLLQLNFQLLWCKTFPLIPAQNLLLQANSFHCINSNGRVRLRTLNWLAVIRCHTCVHSQAIMPIRGSHPRLAVKQMLWSYPESTSDLWSEILNHPPQNYAWAKENLAWTFNLTEDGSCPHNAQLSQTYYRGLLLLCVVPKSVIEEKVCWPKSGPTRVWERFAHTTRRQKLWMRV